MSTPEFVDIVVRVVPSYGCLPLVRTSEGAETYRGEFKREPAQALQAALRFLVRAQDSKGGAANEEH